MKIALVCIAKDEDHYIDEWIHYYLKIGFSDIFVYQNNWRCNLDKSKYSNVHWIEFDGEYKQLYAYNDFIEKHYNEYDWAAFFDVDEFLALKQFSSVEQFLQEYRDVPALAINWRIFGDSDLNGVVDDDYSVLKRFIYSDDKLDESCKVMLNFDLCKNKVKFVYNPHCVTCMMIDPNRSFMLKGIGNTKHIANNNSQKVELFHYRNKTYTECYTRKFNKPVCDITFDKSILVSIDKFNESFKYWNKNIVLNDIIANEQL